MAWIEIIKFNMTIHWYTLFAIFTYFIILASIAYFRSRKAVLDDYLVGSRNSAWWLVSFGMISDTLSGVTYVSVPGNTVLQGGNYLFIVLGNFVGSLIISFVILPLYYKKKLISIYSYLREHLNIEAEKTAAILFFISRSFGATARLYLSISILYLFLSPILPFSIYMAFVLTMLLILLYTWKGGIKSLVWTDAYQSLFLIIGFLSVLFYLYSQLHHPINSITLPTLVSNPMASNFYLKLFLGGVFINIAMNGLDQSIMQKCLSCPNLRAAQKNIFAISIFALVLSILFVLLGKMLANYYQQNGFVFPTNTLGNTAGDLILTNVVFNYFPTWVVILFVLGLTAATFSSADSVLTTLATTLHVDLLPQHWKRKIPVRLLHLVIAILILCLLCAFHHFPTHSMVDVIFKYATYAYGPLLGLFALVIFKKSLKPKSFIISSASVLSIASSYYLSEWAPLYNYNFGLELLMVNSILFLIYFRAATLIRSKF